MLIDVVIQTKSSYSDIYQILQRNVDQIKAFSFLSCSVFDKKSTKGGVLIYIAIAKQPVKREQTHPVCLHSGKVQKGGAR